MQLPGSLKLEGNLIHVLQRPVVYIWMRGEDCLYIGVSRLGFGRVLYRHHIIGVKDHIQSTDVIHLYHVSDREMNQLERELIEKLRPIYNGKTSLGEYI
jgi:hypothetical protein